MCSISTWRSRVEKPTAAMAEKYWAHTAMARPMMPKATMTRHILTIYPVLPLPMP